MARSGNGRTGWFWHFSLVLLSGVVLVTPPNIAAVYSIHVLVWASSLSAACSRVEFGADETPLRVVSGISRPLGRSLGEASLASQLGARRGAPLTSLSSLDTAALEALVRIVMRLLLFALLHTSVSRSCEIPSSHFLS